MGWTFIWKLENPKIVFLDENFLEYHLDCFKKNIKEIPDLPITHFQDLLRANLNNCNNCCNFIQIYVTYVTIQSK
ncbi:MAG TPA: hypothetical protein DIT94_02795 [Deltaproteobacteria bacterium]|nr:hypothetical protein [Deltaproteobacteria bacterium]HCP33284.1 hypothetical protein [Deltaproteobacteria bacterium]